jgi:hypothetical protein
MAGLVAGHPGRIGCQLAYRKLTVWTVLSFRPRVKSWQVPLAALEVFQT